MGQSGSKKRFQQRAATYLNDQGTLLYIKKSREGKAEAARVPLIWLSNANGEEIPAAYIQSDWDSQKKYTLIYSHGEAEDLGIAVSDMSEVADFTGCDVLCYEYSGYGLASGEPSESNCYADIRAAYEYLVKDKGVDPLRIVLYGKSLGTGSSVDLASQVDVGGLVMVSSFLSLSYSKVLRVTGVQRTDAFSNVDKIHRVKCQVLIIHGMRDRIVPYSSVVNLFKKAPNKAPPVIVPFADHDNISTEFRYEVLPFVKRYIDTLNPPIAGERQKSTLDKISGITDRLRVGSDVKSKVGRGVDSDSEASESVWSATNTRTSIGGRPSIDSFATTAAGSTKTAHVKGLRVQSIDRAKEKFWRILGADSDDETRISTESNATTNILKRSFIDNAIQSQRTKAMVNQLNLTFEGKLTPEFLLQCLRVRHFDMDGAADVARKYRKMMKTLGCHPRRGVSIYDAEVVLRRKVFAAPDGVDINDHPTLCISAQAVIPKQSNWAPTLVAMIYMVSYLHECEETQIRGIAILIDLRGSPWGLKHRDFWKRLFRALLTYYPCRLKLMYIVDANRLTQGHFVTGRLAGSHLSRRNVVEVNPTAIGRYFNRSSLPDYLGGCAETNMAAFIEKRKRKEELRMIRQREATASHAQSLRPKPVKAQSVHGGSSLVGRPSKTDRLNSYKPSVGSVRNQSYRMSSTQFRTDSFRSTQGHHFQQIA